MRILLTRPLAQSRDLARALHLRGHHVLMDPVLSVEGVPFEDIDASRYRAVLLTSANAARYAPRFLSRLPAFAVGEATATAARKIGYQQVTVAQGDAASLAKLVATTLPKSDAPLLHPCGAEVREGTAERFAEVGLVVEPVVVYATRAASALSPPTKRALSQGHLDAVLLFSPKTARVFVDLVDDAGLMDTLAEVDAVAWSQDVADACEPDLWHSVRVVPQRDRATLLALLEGPAA